jgi:tetratricopeptide (TPR) repeat protein
MMRNVLFICVFTFLLASCQNPEKQELDQEIMASMGGRIKTGYTDAVKYMHALIKEDSTHAELYTGLAETQIILYIFGFSSREETLPDAREAFHKAYLLDSLSSEIKTLEGMLSMLDWKWSRAEEAFRKAIVLDPTNLKARHWYSLYHSAMGDFENAMAQSDTISTMDSARNYLIGRGSLLYFARRNMELKELMIEVVEMDTSVAWGYDWLGMAYIELEDYQNSIDTYYKAFRLSDGTVEVGGGLGHALGLAGEYKPAKEMAEFYRSQSEDHYLPPVQRAFIHIGIGEYDEAFKLLEQAYEENSWFLAFIQIEPWYDPLRGDPRLDRLVEKMNFPTREF